MTPGTADTLLCIPPSTMAFVDIVIKNKFRTKFWKNKDLPWWESTVENPYFYLYSPPEHI